MNVKGFLIEDDHGQEFVVVCEQPHGQPEKVFALRGWQRRRMVPFQCDEDELFHIIKVVRITLKEWFQRLPNMSKKV